MKSISNNGFYLNFVTFKNLSHLNTFRFYLLFFWYCDSVFINSYLIIFII